MIYPAFFMTKKTRQYRVSVEAKFIKLLTNLMHSMKYIYTFKYLIAYLHNVEIPL
jgi:hypothetical protein